MAEQSADELLAWLAKYVIALIWPVTPASSRQWSRQDVCATAKLGQHDTAEIFDKSWQVVI
ncbi:MAG: hypothetical protein ABSF46_16845 [Terriglobia bacterium]|jgi:hypothetical protein